MPDIPKPELLTAEYVAACLKTTHAIVKAGVSNGTLPIGFVGGSRVIIVKARFEKWVNGEDLGVKTCHT
jgi:hypothetical protein